MAAVCTAVLLHASCSIDETFMVSGPSGQDGTVLSFTGDPMHGQKVKTRASDPKDEDEKRINQLYIFFFDQNGNYLEGSYLEGYPLASKNGGFYAPGEGVTTLKIANDPADSYFADPTAASSAIVYALANVDPAVMGFDELDEYGRPEGIRNMQDLEDIIELFRIPAVHRLPHPAFAPHLIPHPQSGGQRIPRKRKPHPPPLARHAVPASHQHGLRTNGTRGRLRCPRQNHMIHPLPFRPYVSLHFAPCPERTPRAKKEKQKASPKAETRMEIQPRSIPRTPERKDSRT